MDANHSAYPEPHPGFLSQSPDHVYRKVTQRLMPFLFLCYVLSFLDRINIGYAKSQMVTLPPLRRRLFLVQT